jgi:hypothetical protein
MKLNHRWIAWRFAVVLVGSRSRDISAKRGRLSIPGRLICTAEDDVAFMPLFGPFEQYAVASCPPNDRHQRQEPVGEARW